jgi:HK97 family phage portal protein
VFSGSTGGNWDVERAVKEGLERVMYVMRCVDVIASNQAGLPILTRKGNPTNGEVVDHPQLFKVLNMRANSYEDAYQFRYRLSAQALLSKRGVFIEMVKDGFGDIKELHLLPPHLVEPIPDAQTFVSGYRLQNQLAGEIIIPKEKVIWIRLKPHPTDPYCQLTPLTAAGLSVDTDFLARLYNRNFLVNGGKGGLLVSIAGLAGSGDADEVKRRFKGGPTTAGESTVIEADQIQVENLSATPADIQWLQAIAGSKEDILLAFGVPESVMGNASGRTYDNADAEKENFWDVTEKGHCDGLARGLDPLTGSLDDDMFESFDYDGVDVLQRQKRARHDRIKDDFQKGLCTIDEYWEAIGKEPWNVPGTRSIFLPTGVVISRTPEDEASVAKLPVVGAAQQALLQMMTQGALNSGSPTVNPNLMQASFNEAQAQNQQGDMSTAQRASALAGSGRPALTGSSWMDDATDPNGGSRYGPYVGKAIGSEPEFKEYDLDGEWSSEDTDPRIMVMRAGMEGEFTGVIDGWMSQQESIIPERLMHVKMRKGTRHWDGDGAETKKLDPSYAVDTDRWAETLKSDMERAMKRAGLTAARTAAQDMVDSGVASVMHAKGLGNRKGRSELARVYGSTDNAESAVYDALRPLLDIVEEAAKNQSRRIEQKIAEMDDAGASMQDIQREVKSMMSKRNSWREQLATYLTTAVMEGVQHTTYGQAGTLMTKTWNTVEDERVRHSHERIDRTKRVIGAAFKVGSSRMQYPGDPRGDISERANCRCYLSYGINERRAATYDRYATGD